MKDIDYIEIELNGTCNRRCGFCPNSLPGIDRLTDGKTMSDDVLHRLIADLQKAEYRQPISFSRYGENYHRRHTKDFLDKVRMIHEALPHCRLTNGTNGDFLDAAIIQQSADAGLAFLHINYYPANEELENQNQWLAVFLQRFQMYYGGHKPHMDIRPGCYKAKWRAGGMDIEFESKRPCDVMCSNRGGAVGESYTRTTSCTSTRLYIDYNGNVMTCCHSRSDILEHAPLILGDINEQSIIEIATGDVRKRLLQAISSTATLPEPCRRCNANYQGGW